jgi:asparagine synthase (glutamine-hydrolysing)
MAPRLCAHIVDTLAHRGPDGRGLLMGDGYWLGHRRLAVIDIGAPGAQPMTDASGGLHVTYNGEIYNYRELRSELEALGHHFTSASDTEVLLEAYRAWGTAALDRLRGMFAFALRDDERDEVILVRDRFGVKPLVYAEIGPWLAFASELAALREFPGFQARLNPRSVSAFLSCRQPMGRETMLANVSALQPGELAVIRAGRLTVQHWWELPRPRRARGRRATRARALRSAVKEAMMLALVADVPVAVLLSGGLDSSVVAYEVSSCTPEPPPCFTMQIDDTTIDESGLAAQLAERLNAEHHPVPVTATDYVTRLQELAAVRDQPLGLHNEIALHELCCEVSAHARVLLSGEGADELFWGYARIFRSPWLRRRLRLTRAGPAPVRRWLWQRWEEAGPERSEFDYFLTRYMYFPIEEKLLLFSPSMRAAVESDRHLQASLRSIFYEHPGSFEQRIERVFLRFHLRGLLQAIDAMAMRSGVEVRVPFLDQELVDLAMHLPHRDKLRWRSPLHALASLGRSVGHFSERNDESKVALRRAYRGSLPPSVLRRRKIPFALPLDDWVGHDLGVEARRLLLSPDARSRELFDGQALARWLQDDRRAGRGRRTLLLVALEVWLRAWFPAGPLLGSAAAERERQPTHALG